MVVVEGLGPYSVLVATPTTLSPTYRASLERSQKNDTLNLHAKRLMHDSARLLLYRLKHALGP